MLPVLESKDYVTYATAVVSLEVMVILVSQRPALVMYDGHVSASRLLGLVLLAGLTMAVLVSCAGKIVLRPAPCAVVQ